MSQKDMPKTPQEAVEKISETFKSAAAEFGRYA